MNQPSKLKIFIVNQSNLNVGDLEFFVVRCDNAGALDEALAKHRDCIRVVACTSEDIVELENTLMIHQINALLLHDTGNTPIEFHEPWHELTTRVTSERLLKIFLCNKAASCLHAEALQHRQDGNHSLAKLCFNDAARALRCSMTFL